jgi:hypothetical protein
LNWFLVRFWAFLGKGSSKTPYKYFCRKKSTKVDKAADVSFSSTSFFVLSHFRVRVFLSNWGSKHYFFDVAFFSPYRKSELVHGSPIFLAGPLPVVSGSTCAIYAHGRSCKLRAAASGEWGG